MGVLPLHRRFSQELIGQAGGVAQQILHGGGLRHIHQRHLPVALHRHFLAGVFGHEAADRVAEQQQPALHQHHHRHRHQRLGHRVNPKDGVARHRHARRRILLTQALEQGNLAPSGDQRHRAGQALAVDLGLQHIQQALGALRTQANLGRGSQR